MNSMKKIKIEKVTLNVGAGKDPKQLERGEKLLENITGIKPVKTTTQKRIQGWGLRPGLPIGCKITLRGEEAKEMVERLVYAKDNVFADSSFDDQGNISLGIKEYVDIKDAKYDVEIGMMGLQANITLTRPGFRVKNKRIRKSKIPARHKISKDEAKEFMKENYKVKIGEEQ